MSDKSLVRIQPEPKVVFIGWFPSGQRGMTVNHLLRLRKFESSPSNKILRCGAEVSSSVSIQNDSLKKNRVPYISVGRGLAKYICVRVIGSSPITGSKPKVPGSNPGTRNKKLFRDCS